MQSAKHRHSRGDLSYVIHSQTELEKTFSDDIGNTYEVIEMKKKNTKDSSHPHGVWKFFCVAKNICDGTGDKVVCSLCFKENEVKTYSKVTSSSNLWRHLQQKHGIYENKTKDEPKEYEAESAIHEMLREEGEEDMAFMEEVVVGSEKDLEDGMDMEEKFTVSAGGEYFQIQNLAGLFYFCLQMSYLTLTRTVFICFNRFFKIEWIKFYYNKVSKQKKLILIKILVQSGQKVLVFKFTSVG